MSRVYREAGRWFADWTDEGGVRHRKSLKGIETREAARGLLAELVAAANRRGLGLEPTAVSTTSTVWDLCEWWLRRRCPAASLKKETNRLTRHVKGSTLGSMKVAQLRRLDVDRYLTDLETSGLSPASVNHLRAKLRTVLNRARRADLFSGTNPVEDTEFRKVQKRQFATLSADQVPVVLNFVAPIWRPFFAAAVFMGLRKGECCGMRKADVDLEHRTLLVRHSHARDTTKGGHEDLLPIPEPMVPYVAQALKTKGAWLFPDQKGKPRGPECDPHLRLRTALARAGIVEGYLVQCRACTAANKPQPFDVKKLHPERPDFDCPTHKLRLWVTAVPLHMRFHDLRHTTATVLLRHGVDAHRVQRIMRHASINTTTGTYGHLLVEDLRGALDGAFVAKSTAENRQTANSTTSDEAPTERGNIGNDSEKRSAPGGTRTHDPRLRRPMR